MEQYVDEIAALNDEIKKLKKELRTAGREIAQRDRTIAAIENNFNVKMNMFRSLVAENEKHQRFLKHMMKSSVDFLILLDNTLSVAYCSDVFLNRIGVSFLSEIEGKNIHDVYERFVTGKLSAKLSKGLLSAVGNNSTHRHDIEINYGANGSGSHVYRVTNTPMFDDGFKGVIVSWNDMTDVMKAKNEAEEANRGKSRFLATMSHEIRTPMNAVIGIAQILLNKNDLPDDVYEAIDKIHRSGASLLGIINDILDMSKIETGKLEIIAAEYDVPSLINDTAQLNVVRIGSKEIKFEVEADPTLPSCLIGDELRIKQILNNILSNAIKYTVRGFVRLTIGHTAHESGVALIFTVEDSGQGMTSDDVECLFSEYQRFNVITNRTIEGTGLGLVITKRLAELMDGSIEVESAYGKGSKVTVTVIQKRVPCEPIGAEIAEKLKTLSFFTSRKERRRAVRDIMPYGKVLVVDDVETNLYVAKGLLSPYKIEVETALSGFKVIELISAGLVYDIIFMDHMMPDMDGIETTARLRGMGYKGTIFALTANALAGNEAMFLECGFDGFISKPIDIRRLDDCLVRFVRDKHPEEAEKVRREMIAMRKPSPSADEEPKAPFPSMQVVDPQLRKVFCRDVERSIKTISDAALSGDIKLFTTSVHAMKSALANVGENDLANTARVLEEAGRDNNIEHIKANFGSFTEALRGIVNKFKASNNEDSAGAVASADADIGTAANTAKDTDRFKEQLAIVVNACRDYDDASAYKALGGLNEFKWDRDTAAALESIRESLFLRSDFEAAEAIASELQQKGK